MSAKYCRHCGEQARLNGKFCYSCGGLLGAVKVSKEHKAKVVPESHKKNAHRNPAKIKKIVWTTLPILGLLMLLLANPASDAATFISGEYFGDNDIKNLAARSGFNYTGKVEFYRAHPELVNADKLNEVCLNEAPNTIEYGCFRTDLDKIYILDSKYVELDDVESWTAAHELMHKVYLDHPPSTQLLTDIQNTLSSSQEPSVTAIREDINRYPEDATVRKNELHSFFSAVPDYHASNSINNYYSKYFSNRNSPFLAKNSFDSKLKEKADTLEQQRAALTNQSNDLDNYKAQYLDRIEAYLPSNIYYGDTQRYNQNIDALNGNSKIYNQNVEQYERDRVSFNQRIEEYNSILKSFLPSGSTLPTL